MCKPCPACTGQGEGGFSGVSGTLDTSTLPPSPQPYPTTASPDGLWMKSADCGIRRHQGAGMQNCGGNHGAVCRVSLVPVELEIRYPGGNVHRGELYAVYLRQSVGELADGKGQVQFALADLDAYFSDRDRTDANVVGLCNRTRGRGGQPLSIQRPEYQGRRVRDDQDTSRHSSTVGALISSR